MTRRGLLAACAAAAIAWGGAPAPALGKTRVEAPAPRAVGQQTARMRRGSAAAARVERGKASYYAPNLAGRRMADGGRFDPRSDAAAHRTLPLGSKAHVRKLGNGRTATVTVRDRGPHTRGRVIDVSPGTAERLGMKDAGVASVEVAPLQAPRTGDGPEAKPVAGGGPGRRARR